MLAHLSELAALTAASLVGRPITNVEGEHLGMQIYIIGIGQTGNIMSDFRNFVGVAEAALRYEGHLDSQLDLLELAHRCGAREASIVISLNPRQSEWLRETLEAETSQIWQYIREAAFLPKRGEDKKRPFTPWEKERAADITHGKYRQYAEPRLAWVDLAKRMSAENGLPWQDNLIKVPVDQVYNYLKDRNMLPDLPKDSAIRKRLNVLRDELITNLNLGTAPPTFRHDIANTLRDIVKEQEPVIQAWRELGLDARPEEVRQLLHSRGAHIINPQYLKYATIDFLKQVRDKVQKGEALQTPQERTAYNVWKTAAKAHPMRKTDDPTKAVGPEDVYRAIQHAGYRIIRPEDVELQLIDKVKQDLENKKAYEEDPNKGIDTHQRKFQRAIDRWVKGEGGKPGMQTVAGTDEPSPDPYLSIDYHASQKGRDPKVLAQYFDEKNQPTQLFYDQIMKPACIATNQVIIRTMKRVGFIPSHFQIDYNSRNSICGAENPENTEAAKMRSAFLGGQDTTDLVQTVVQKMLDSTAIPRWIEQEGIRMRTAQIEAEKLLLKMLKRQNQYFKVISGRAGNIMSKTHKGAKGGRASQDLGDISSTETIPGEEPETPEETRSLLDQEVLQRLLDDPDSLARLKALADQTPGEEGDEMKKLVAQAELKMAKMKQKQA